MHAYVAFTLAVALSIVTSTVGSLHFLLDLQRQRRHQQMSRCRQQAAYYRYNRDGNDPFAASMTSNNFQYTPCP